LKKTEEPIHLRAVRDETSLSTPASGFRELLKLVDGQRGHYETLMVWNRIRQERVDLKLKNARQGDSNVLPPGHGVMTSLTDCTCASRCTTGATATWR
jgi:hypothetical protein